VLRLAFVLVLAAQTSSPQTSFEVASVKPNTEATAETSTRVDPGGRLYVTAAPLRWLIASAYGNAAGALRYEQLIDAPAWLRSERFDITAQVPPEFAGQATTSITMRPFLRALLEERFKLRTHRDSREIPVYALVRSRPDALGPRLALAPVDCSRDAVTCGFGGGPMGRIKADALSSDLLLQLLASASGRIVVDRTGLKGPFAIDLEYSPDQTASDDPSIFTAVQEQLGLKLESTRAPVDVLVIDSVDRPTPD
jgi:uncharacterized protein (TIGR03435 family)